MLCPSKFWSCIIFFNWKLWWVFVIGSLSNIFSWISEIVDFTNWIWNHLELASKCAPKCSLFAVNTIYTSRCILCVILLNLNALIHVFLAGGVCTIFGEYLGPRLKKMEIRWRATPVHTQTFQWRKPNGFYLLSRFNKNKSHNLSSSKRSRQS